MMKFIFMLMFMIFMLNVNKVKFFYYNICFLTSFMLMFMYMYKDIMWINISILFSLNYYSIWLIMLSLWIIGLMFMSLEEKFNLVKFLIFMSLLMILLMFFMVLDVMIFYLLFEVSLIPTFFLIIYWGSNIERISAGYYLMMYMLFISFPLLVYIMYMYKYSLTLKFSVMILMMEKFTVSIWSYYFLYLSFFIKMPLYLFHIWLPKAHVEAPVYGSMILAGILLKMGSYGLIRFFELMMGESLKYNYIIFSVSLIGSVFVSIMCLTQIDMKSLVAYSSVVHMNLMLCSIMTFFKLGFLGSYIMMISHGLCSSGLFYMVNVYYIRSKSRLIMLNKGMMKFMPTMSMWWFLLCVTNFSFPFSMSFFSEVLMLMVLLGWDSSKVFYLMLICFFSSAYSLYLFSYIQQGESSYLSTNMFLMSMSKEFMVLILHFFPLFMILFNLMEFM